MSRAGVPPAVKAASRRLTWLPLALAALVLALAQIAPRVSPLFEHPILAFRLLRNPAASHLAVPVDGVTAASLTGSWGSPRPGGRAHQGIDIFAPRNTPIRSTTSGIVVTVGRNDLGGRIVRIFGPAGEWHYYAHLERFAEIHPGQPVAPGQILGYVGDSGNAQGTPTHLHYGIYRWRGGAMDPYPRLHP